MQAGEACTPHYSAKKRPTADPKLNPEPATKLTEQLAADTVYGHMQTPGLTVVLLGERIILVTAGPLGAHRKG